MTEVRVGFVPRARVSSNSGVAARSSAQLAADRRLCTASHSSQAGCTPTCTVLPQRGGRGRRCENFTVRRTERRH